MRADKRAIIEILETRPLASECVLVLEHYVMKMKLEAAGWMLAECCNTLDIGADPRELDVTDMLSRMSKELGWGE